jgi:outer membrane receptor protein involved in Fe transport
MSVYDDPFGDLTLHPVALTGNIGISYKINSCQRLSIAVQNGYRAPNINDINSFGIADFRYEVPAYELYPERSVNMELGYKLKLDRFSAGFSAFYNHLFDLVINQPATFEGLDSLDGYKIYRKENSGIAYIT